MAAAGSQPGAHWPFLAPWHSVTYNKAMVMRVDE